MALVSIAMSEFLLWVLQSQSSNSKDSISLLWKSTKNKNE